MGSAASRASSPVKWAGGKARLLSTLRSVLLEPFARYHEPFAGGAAAFWDLASRASPTTPGPDMAAHTEGMKRPSFEAKRFFLSDANPSLVAFYRALRDDVYRLIEALSAFAGPRLRERYMVERALFNLALLGGDSSTEQAARFLYLNKSAFNGLWRVNRKGEFNVPFGDYDTPLLFDTSNLIACSKTLRHANLAAGDFETAFASVGAGDLVYCDPPYVPVKTGRVKDGGGSASFTSYAMEPFGPSDQERLRDCALAAMKRGAKVVISNSLVAEPLYAHEQGFVSLTVTNTRSVSAKAAGRGSVEELLIVGRAWTPGEKERVV